MTSRSPIGHLLLTSFRGTRPSKDTNQLERSNYAEPHPHPLATPHPHDPRPHRRGCPAGLLSNTNQPPVMLKYISLALLIGCVEPPPSPPTCVPVCTSQTPHAACIAPDHCGVPMDPGESPCCNLACDADMSRPECTPRAGECLTWACYDHDSGYQYEATTCTPLGTL